MTQPALPRSQVARLETASQRSKKYRSQSGLEVLVNFVLPVRVRNYSTEQINKRKARQQIPPSQGFFLFRLWGLVDRQTEFDCASWFTLLVRFSVFSVSGITNGLNSAGRYLLKRDI
jgi:hypothetical protein